jgi:hypothetical protein
MRFQVHKMEVHSGGTRVFYPIPAYEMPIIRAGWPASAHITTEKHTSVMERPQTPLEEFGRLCGDYKAEVVRTVYPGPEALAAAMQREAEATAEYERADQARIQRDLIAQEKAAKAKGKLSE